jgi:hypothetical protein
MDSWLLALDRGKILERRQMELEVVLEAWVFAEWGRVHQALYDTQANPNWLTTFQKIWPSYSPSSRNIIRVHHFIRHHHQSCSVARPGARQDEHAPLSLQTATPIGSRGQHEIGHTSDGHVSPATSKVVIDFETMNEEWKEANAHGQN